MLWLRFAMIHSDPPISRMTIRTPKASASTLLVLSGPVVMCRKNTRCTPICAIARTTRATGMLGSHTRLVPATKKNGAPEPSQITSDPLCDASVVQLFVAGCYVKAVVDFIVSGAHFALPSKY